MAEKQLALSDDRNVASFAKDDPLAELARIVGDDSRPAVHQLRELERQQERVRVEPAFDLEAELLRELGMFEDAAAPAPVVEPVMPAQPVAAQPVQPVRVEPPMAPPAAAAPVAEPVRVMPQPLPQAAEIAPIPRAEPIAPVAHRVEPVMAPVSEPSLDFDLADELTQSLHLEPVEARPVEARTVEARPVAPEPVAPPRAPAVQATAPAAPSGFAPVPSFVEPVTADALLSDVARFPVPPVAQRPAQAPAPEPVARKSSYPFTPNFTRATPTMAGQAGGGRSFARPVSQSEPVPPVAAAAQPSVAPPQVPVAPQASVVPQSHVAPQAPIAPQANAEPEIDLDDFAFDLSDLDMGLEAESLDMAAVAPMADAPVVAPPAPARTPVVEAAVHPAPVAPAPVRPAQPVQQVAMPVRQPPAAPAPVQAMPAQAMMAPAIPVERDPVQPVPGQMMASQPVMPPLQVMPEPEAIEEDEFAFDPALLAEAEEQVTPIAELDVPQLPVNEPVKPMAHASDYDLDIDAEMAQLFQPAPRAAAPRPASHEAPSAQRAEPFGRAPVVPIGMADEAFERAMEEDFRRTFAERQADGRQGFDPLYPEDAVSQIEEPRSSRRLVLLASAAVVVLVAGAGVAYSLFGGKATSMASGEPQIILADKSPSKMVPVEKGGKTVPNQDKAVYDRVSGGSEAAPRQDELVTSEEQPMDVVQRTLTPESLPLEGENDMVGDDGAERLVAEDGGAVSGAAASDHAPALPPRKVRTMVVKPDGTLVAREEPDDPAADAGAGAIRPSLAQSTSRTAPGEMTSALPNANLAGLHDEAATQVAAVDTHVPVPTSARAPAVAKLPAAAAKPVTPAAQPAAPVQTAAIAPAAAPASASTGDYVIQVASLPSEADAKASYQKMSGKFASVIGGRSVEIRKADIAGKGTYYRVRIAAGSRADANALCDKLKAAGGSCLVTR
ncbi:hypothetical protein BJF92_22065 [Rhizobium rhizosphaerae]|uniref:SPOR domain-containing protein n=1 Tax=Xaviernesmea rhizosphaerae TaxID=1672749 RepID=A0A1Q9AJ56_9HYPH|nr:SPOR domain-containing protein [Xaviernesmea rhizosphaerae]OLP55261.1 hypothetical protein BJF92_22065 [Xaviernesmea rhizosphaerae]